MLKGTVKWFNVKKGYGFIQPIDGEKDVFVHVSQLEKNGIRRLSDGQVVSFELFEEQRSGKIAAGNISLV